MGEYKRVLAVASAVSLILIMALPSSAHATSSAQATQSVNHPTCDKNGGCWWYVKGRQTTFSQAPVGIQAYLSIERPAVQGAVLGGQHSLAAISIQTVKNGETYNAIELGWAVAPALYTDEEPHLFAFDVRNGAQTTPQGAQCWQDPTGCGWFAKPGAKHHLGENLPPAYGSGVTHPFAILFSGGNWWVNYDNEWIGYFKGSYWNSAFTQGSNLQWYGEVQTVGFPSGACTEMGDGRFGTQAGAAIVGAMGYWMGAKHTFAWARAQEDTDYGNPTFYNMGNHSTQFTSFTYGGPGGTASGANCGRVP